MIHFAWPWGFVLLILPWFVYRYCPPALAAEQAALWVPSLADFETFEQQRQQRRSRLRLPLAILCWLLLVGSAARPQWLGDPLVLPAAGRNLVLAVDLSRSMQNRDFRLHGEFVERLTAVKDVAGDFIHRRGGDRLGLVLFGEQAYVQSPLTFDRLTVEQFLAEATLGLAGERTAIGDAIGLTVKRMSGKPGDRQVLVLLTDGENTAGLLTPARAAEIAARRGWTIYPISIGPVTAAASARSPLPAEGRPGGPLLREIAVASGGRTFHARDTERLAEIYAEIDRLEPVERREQVFRPVTELYVWPLGLALLPVATLVLLALRPQGRGA